MANIKISVIGAGSAVFSLNLIKDLCLTPNLKGSTISFMNTNEERLCTVHAICRRYADEMKTELKLEKTLHRRESLKNANFVINLALAAGHERLREGWSIAHKHGYGFGGGTWPWWYHIDDETEKKWKENPRKWYNEYFIGGEEGTKEMAKVSKDTSIKLA